MAAHHGNASVGTDPRRSRQLRVVVLYDGGATDWSAADIRSVLEPVNTVSEALAAAGHEVLRVGVQPDLTWIDTARTCDLVFNLCEGVGGVSRLECNVASALELLGIPHTGGSAWTMTVCHRKPLLNALLAAADLPVPQWFVPNGRRIPADFPTPAIVKPAAEDASMGIDQGAVHADVANLLHRVDWIESHIGESIVQRYIDGREFNVAFVGESTLPLSEIDFRNMPDGAWRIVSFDAKWTRGSAEDAGTQPVCPARVEPELADYIIRTAREAWDAVQGSGYGRVDLRVDRDGRPWVLEVNPNPDISTDAGLANMAAAAGWSYRDLVLRIVSASLSRPKPKPGAPPHGDVPVPEMGVHQA